METMITNGGFTIKKCCASCLFKEVVSDSIRNKSGVDYRKCRYSGLKVNIRDTCPMWTISREWETATKSPGMTKSPEYFAWYKEKYFLLKERVDKVMKQIERETDKDKIKDLVQKEQALSMELSDFMENAHTEFPGKIQF